MKIIAMIPARYSASRFPGKLMQDLGGESVILRTYKATMNTKLFSEVYVVTDSEIISHEIISNGGQVIMSVKEHESGSDRIAEAVQSVDCDVVVNVQGDEPFTDRESLKKVISVFETDDEKEIDLASLMVHITDPDEIQNSNTVKVIVDQRNFALYFSRSPIPYQRDTTVQTKYYKHKGVYAFRKEALLDFTKLPMKMLEVSEKIECIRYLEFGKKIKMVETDVQGVEIDTPEDLQRAKNLLRENN
jgi:3-deoxy-manno-octulosonate cytidylyltransferase (CMP-KDO synthetase)|tara:strand:+ start:919 stop:1656 length:738 start_codon:yes stop_codon:yes gene_type:complete